MSGLLIVIRNNLSDLVRLVKGPVYQSIRHQTPDAGLQAAHLPDGTAKIGKSPCRSDAGRRESPWIHVRHSAPCIGEGNLPAVAAAASCAH
jgi:hypothetical protein